MIKKGFRDQFKYYKRKNVPLDLGEVVDINTLESAENTVQNVKTVTCLNTSKNCDKFYGVKDPSQWKIYEFTDKPGLLFIKNPFETRGQRYWVVRCLQYYTKKPSKLNIDAHNIISSDEDWWEFCKRQYNEKQEGSAVLEKLRWATFGYHHDWDTKEYSESSKCEFPADLGALCSFLAKVLNFDNFNAEAAIINMYPFGSSLSGHTDHSEVNVSAPLFSFSFGQSAIFLIGGHSIEDKTTPILLESGDVLIMSGESRLCYHGVPRILPTQKSPWEVSDEQSIESPDNEVIQKEITDKLWDNRFWEPFERYIRKSRINMNVRQVLFPGQSSLSSSHCQSGSFSG